jgi:hypothetical protein
MLTLRIYRFFKISGYAERTNHTMDAVGLAQRLGIAALIRRLWSSFPVSIREAAAVAHRRARRDDGERKQTHSIIPS